MIDTLEVTAEEDEFWEALTKLHQKLLAEQQPMDYEMDKLLSENAWDLYAD